MSEISKPVAIEPEMLPQLSHRRILWTMAIVVITASILSSVFVSRQFGLGLLTGGILAFLNYYWLKISLKRIFDNAIAGEKPSFLSLNYFLRYLGLGLVIYIIYLTQVVPVVSVLLGLCVFAIAIVIEGFLKILSSISKREEL